MGTFLDMRTSQNASNPFTATLSTFATNPSLIGVIGLQTRNVANPIVKLEGTLGVATSFDTFATVTVLFARGTTNPTGGTIIYTAVVGVPTNPPAAVGGITSPQIITVCAADLLAPAAAETVYTMLAYASTDATRTGPESFQGIAANTATTP
ncbi:hypothetical protein SAMN05444487_105141 [Marininema mesophilum]|uniref:Uncharacterized protein n=1 Tax=Marininema mesophilum TaxID=1048340 RepID=A0A1H2VL11_9BACL|nr:hypothetical protein [Marininema mesophilum]SDW68977.1 hypothetical protein SAMN05444487_105141 [Marininema mesophilum]